MNFDLQVFNFRFKDDEAFVTMGDFDIQDTLLQTGENITEDWLYGMMLWSGEDYHQDMDKLAKLAKTILRTKEKIDKEIESRETTKTTA